MPPVTARLLLEAIASIGTLGSICFYFFSVVALASYLRDKHEKLNRLSSTTRDTNLRGISILKPLKGLDPEMWESLCSHCEQNYPEYQLIFGVSDPADPAIALVHKLREEYPNI